MNTNVFEQSVYSNTNQSNTQTQQTKRRHATIVTLALLVSLSGCTTMSARDKNTAVGAGVGAVTGAILTGGSSWGTVGNQIGR